MSKESAENTESTMQKMLDFAYNKAINGVAGLDSAEELGDDYIKEGGSTIDQVDSLIRWQNMKAATSGFVTGVGGLITIPIALPANITSVLYIQIRMIAAIAHIGGYDLKNDKIKTFIYSCLVGNEASQILKQAGIQVAEKVAISTIKNISGKVLVQINQKIGFRLVTKFGEKGVINLAKAVPLLGGFISGSVDAISTNTIGNVAKNTFIK